MKKIENLHFADFSFHCRLQSGHKTKALRYKLFSVKAYQNNYGNYDDYNETINHN